MNKQTEETIWKMVETEAQKEFMRYAFLRQPKTALGKLVSGAWRKFKEWWDEKQRPQVEERTRESVLVQLEKYKNKQRNITDLPPKKDRGIDR